MGWLKKLLGKDESHDKWLAAHPGKESTKSLPPSVDEEERARVRSHMEEEMDSASQKRNAP